jgi:hypothetical protein
MATIENRGFPILEVFVATLLHSRRIRCRWPSRKLAAAIAKALIWINLLLTQLYNVLKS